MLTSSCDRKPVCEPSLKQCEKQSVFDRKIEIKHTAGLDKLLMRPTSHHSSIRDTTAQHAHHFVVNRKHGGFGKRFDTHLAWFRQENPAASHLFLRAARPLKNGHRESQEKGKTPSQSHDTRQTPKDPTAEVTGICLRKATGEFTGGTRMLVVNERRNQPLEDVVCSPDVQLSSREVQQQTVINHLQPHTVPNGQSSYIQDTTQHTVKLMSEQWRTINEGNVHQTKPGKLATRCGQNSSTTHRSSLAVKLVDERDSFRKDKAFSTIPNQTSHTGSVESSLDPLQDKTQNIDEVQGPNALAVLRKKPPPSSLNASTTTYFHGPKSVCLAEEISLTSSPPSPPKQEISSVVHL